MNILNRSMALCVALALPAITFADNNVYHNSSTQNGGYYIQGDAGLAYVDGNSKFTNIKKSYGEGKFLPRISLGYQFNNNMRVAADYTYYDKIKETHKNVSAETRAQGLGIAAIYDFPTGRLKPYVGARLGLNQIKRKESNTNVEISEKDTKLGTGALFGAGYQFNQNIIFDAGYRYNYLDSNLKTHEASVGVRYQF